MSPPRAETNTTFVYSNIHMSNERIVSNSWLEICIFGTMVCALAPDKGYVPQLVQLAMLELVVSTSKHSFTRTYQMAFAL